MNFSKLFFWKRPVEEPRPESAPEPYEPEIPEGSAVILEEIRHAEISGHPEMVFKTHERVYMGEDGRKCKVTIQTSLQATGCGHNIASPADVGYISCTSKLPVCKVCEQEYMQLREQTRHEKCICRHLVAPHELSYIEGKGFVCDECKKKANAFKHLKAAGRFLGGIFLKPLIINEQERL